MGCGRQRHLEAPLPPGLPPACPGIWLAVTLLHTPNKPTNSQPHLPLKTWSVYGIEAQGPGRAVSEHPYARGVILYVPPRHAESFHTSHVDNVESSVRK